MFVLHHISQRCIARRVPNANLSHRPACCEFICGSQTTSWRRADPLLGATEAATGTGRAAARSTSQTTSNRIHVT